MEIFSINDEKFKKYGKVLKLDVKEIIEVGEKVENPKEGSIYQASFDEFEKLNIAKVIKNEVFGGMPTQVGYCYGHNDSLNALEWHKCSEVNIAVEDLILLLGDVRDVDENGNYDSAKVEAFILKKGEAIEVYATTLHFCPIETKKEGFGCVVGLLEGTNTVIDYKPQDKLLFKKNKWLIAHEDNEALIKKGVFGGIHGENFKL